MAPQVNSIPTRVLGLVHRSTWSNVHKNVAPVAVTSHSLSMQFLQLLAVLQRFHFVISDCWFVTIYRWARVRINAALRKWRQISNRKPAEKHRFQRQSQRHQDPFRTCVDVDKMSASAQFFRFFSAQVFDSLNVASVVLTVNWTKQLKLLTSQ